MQDLGMPDFAKGRFQRPKSWPSIAARTTHQPHHFRIICRSAYPWFFGIVFCLLWVSVLCCWVPASVKHKRHKELMVYADDLLYFVSILFVEMTLNFANVAPERTYKNLNTQDKLIGFAHALFGRYPDFWLKAASTLKERLQPWLSKTKKRFSPEETHLAIIWWTSCFLWIAIGQNKAFRQEILNTKTQIQRESWNPVNAWFAIMES